MHQIHATVAQDFERVNQLIIEQLHSNVDMVENVGHYIIDAGGKRLRPLLVLLSASALGECSDEHVTFAAIIEFIHTATLLHDDVVDMSTLRRGRPTANDKFGNAPSILVGDFLYTRAFQLMVKLGNMPILTHMAETTNIIAEGEVLQLTRAGDVNTNEVQYLDVITRKTAILFAAACYGAATLSGEKEKNRNTLREFGLNLGIAFQMIDDVLDYDGNADTMGKNVGDDLTEGKVTLPLIHALLEASAAEQAVIRHAITEKNSDQIDQIISIVRRCGSIEYTQARARHHYNLALEKLAILPCSKARDALERLTELSINRDH
ncbi:MAG: polyprenyl synthetase family protein [Halioglobus sp.]|nr:polyprenyl synthetase family protein [Halioglobus sp.]